MTKIDLNRVWDDAKAMGATNKDIIGAIAGMFVLLPFVVALQLLKSPDTKLDPSAGPDAVSAWYRAFMALNWHLFIGWTLLCSFAVLAMLVLLLRQERPTVAESLKTAIMVLPSFCIAYFIQNLALEAGMFLLIVPACYLAGRFALIAPVAAAEQEYNPLVLVRRSFDLTRGNGWRIFLVLAILFCTTLIVVMVLSTLAGLLAALFLPQDVAALCVGIVTGAVIAGFETFFALLSAAIYRAATPPEPTPWLTGIGR